ncbi:hypothetical protein CFP56_006980 [Quercus suber]|uniref:Uncharacterized protein n=1 Tax=Quercus suber TaxID=58331 RepID=A0AAW0IDW7_QUESU
MHQLHSISVRYGSDVHKELHGKKPPSSPQQERPNPEEIFTKTHEDLVKQGGDWLSSTANACSVVAGLFVTSTFPRQPTCLRLLKEINTLRHPKFSPAHPLSPFTLHS